MPRTKTYSATSGWVYQYQFAGHEAVAEGDRYHFQTTHDRGSAFDVTVLLPAGVVGGFEAGHGRVFSPTERYALAKMTLFEAFDSAASPELLPHPIRLQPDQLGEIVRTLDL